MKVTENRAIILTNHFCLKTELQVYGLHESLYIFSLFKWGLHVEPLIIQGEHANISCDMVFSVQSIQITHWIHVLERNYFTFWNEQGFRLNAILLEGNGLLLLFVFERQEIWWSSFQSVLEVLSKIHEYRQVDPTERAFLCKNCI